MPGNRYTVLGILHRISTLPSKCRKIFFRVFIFCAFFFAIILLWTNDAELEALQRQYIGDKLSVEYDKFGTMIALQKNGTELSVFTLNITCYTQGDFNLYFRAVNYYRTKEIEPVITHKTPCYVQYSFDDEPPTHESWLCSSAIIPKLNIIELSTRPEEVNHHDYTSKTKQWVRRFQNAKNFNIKIETNDNVFHADYDLTQLHLINNSHLNYCQF